MNSIKKNNSGLTLIELLVTMVIVAIVAAPFVNSFIQAMNVNVDARRLQNATVAAQDLAEEFKAEPLSELLGKYAYTVSTETDKLDVYNFETIEVEGADGENFFLTVQLDPNLVYDAAGNTINGKNLPMFSSLYGSNAMMIFKEYIMADSAFDRTQVRKECGVNIVCNENKEGSDYTYTYMVTFNIKYIYADNTVVEKDPIMKATTFSSDEAHNIYLIAPVFDRTSKEFVDSEDNYYADDVMNITYDYNGYNDNDSRKPSVTFYLVEQPGEHSTVANKLTRFNPSNISVKVETGTATALSAYTSSGLPLKINTNVGRKTEADASSGGLTYSEDNIRESLFMMNIEVRYGSKDGKVLTTFTSTKEE